MKQLYAAVLLLLAASTASAIDLSGREVVIPIAGRVSGAFGTLWRTDLVVTNPSSKFETTGNITFHAAGGGDQQQPFTLTPHAIVTYRDLLATLGYENAQGLVRITSDRPVTARARIYNAGGNGEYGQDVPGVPVEQLAQRTIISALSAAGGNRTNAGISNPHDQPVSVSVSWYDADGEYHGAVLGLPIPARGVLNINDVFDWTGQPREVPLTLVVRSTDAAKAVYVWGSVVRNDTGDAVFVAGQDVVD